MPKGQLSDYAELLGQAYCKQLVDERKNSTFPLTFVTPQFRGLPCYRHSPDTDCWIFVGRLLPEGYAQIKRRTKAQIEEGKSGKNIGVNFLFHRIAYVAFYGHDVEHGASHLCHNEACFNPIHICDEEIGPNNARKGCRGVITCPLHRTIIIDLCPHVPKCILANPPGVRCCAAALQSTPPAFTFASPVIPVTSPPIASSPPTGDIFQMTIPSLALSLPLSAPTGAAQSPSGDYEMVLSSSPVLGPTPSSVLPTTIANFDDVAPALLPGAADLELLSSGNVGYDTDDLEQYV